MHDKRVQKPQPGSESGAYVQEVIRERVRTHCLWRQRPPTDKAGYKCTGLYSCSEGKEAKRKATRKRSKPLVPGEQQSEANGKDNE